MFGSILVNSDQADASLSRIDERAEHVGGTLMKGIGTAAKWGLGLATAAGTGAMALFGLASKASEAAANIDDIAQRTGLSAKTLQEFKHAAEMSGTSMEVVEGSAKKLTSTMGKYASGNKDVVGAFKELGLSAIDSTGKLKSTDEMFPQIIAKLAGMTNETERNALSMKIFGKGAADMAPLLNEGTEGVQDLKDEAHKMGLVMSDESVKAGAKFDDSLTLVKSSLGALVTKVGIEAMPIVQKMLEWFTINMPTIQAVASTAFGVISDLVKGAGGFITNVLMPAFNNLWAWIQPNIPAIKQVMQDAFGLIKIAIQGASDGIGLAIDWVVKFKDILIPLGVGILAGALVFGIYTLAIEAHTLATTIATKVTTGFGTVMAFITSPIGIVVLAIGALIAIFVLAYNNIEGFRNIIDGAWSFIQTKTKEIFENYIMPFIRDQLMPLFKKVFSTIGDIVKAAFTLMGWAWDNVLKPIFNALMFYIDNILVPAWKLAFSVVGGAVKAVFSTIGDLWNKSLKPIFNGILDFVSGVFTGNWTKAWNGVVSVFKGIWEGMKAIAKAPINFIIGGLNGFIDGINEIQIPDWVPGLGGMGFSIPNIPSFAVGTRYLPSDMLIQAHKGEMIVPESENPYANSRGNILGNGKGGITLAIDTFINNRKEDIEELAEELAFYIKKKELGGI